MLSQMAKTFFGQSPLLVLPLLALGIFAAVFLSIIVRTMRGDKSRFDAVAALPLTSEDKND